MQAVEAQCANRTEESTALGQSLAELQAQHQQLALDHRDLGQRFESQAQELAALHAEHEGTCEQLGTAVDQCAELGTLRSTLEAEVQQLHAAHAEELQTMRAEGGEAAAAQESTHQDLVAQIEAARAAEMERACDEHATRVEQLEAQHADALATARTSHAEAVEALQQQMKQQAEAYDAQVRLGSNA